MTLKECCESGKPFKRKKWTFYFTSEEHPKIDVNDAISDDWEIQSKTSYSKADVERAVNAALGGMEFWASSKQRRQIFIEAMKAADASKGAYGE